MQTECLKMWPMLLDMSKDDCLKSLRSLELEAYGTLVSALRAQGTLTSDKLQLLKQTATSLHISSERHRAEIRRAVNDEKLTTIAEQIEGPNTAAEWSVEGRRRVRLVARAVPHTAYLDVAKRVADVACADNAQLPWPAATARKHLPQPHPVQQHQPQTELTATSNSTQLPFDFDDKGPLKKRRRLSQEGPGGLKLPPQFISKSPMPPPKGKLPHKHPINKIQQVYKSQSVKRFPQQYQHSVGKHASIKASTSSRQHSYAVAASSTSSLDTGEQSLRPQSPLQADPNPIDNTMMPPPIRTHVSKIPQPSLSPKTTSGIKTMPARNITPTSQMNKQPTNTVNNTTAVKFNAIKALTPVVKQVNVTQETGLAENNSLQLKSTAATAHVTAKQTDVHRTTTVVRPSTAKIIQSRTPVGKGFVKITQSVSNNSVGSANVQNITPQKLVIVSAPQNITSGIIQQSKTPITLKVKTDNVQTTDVLKPKVITNPVVVSKNQLTPLQLNASQIGVKPKTVTVQGKVRPQGSIILPIQTQNQTSMIGTSSQFTNLSVPVLQGVQWKTIQGKSTVKLLPINANTKMIQKQNISGASPIYVMSKPGNIIVNKQGAGSGNEQQPKIVTLNTNVTHIRPLTKTIAKNDDVKQNILIIKKTDENLNTEADIENGENKKESQQTNESMSEPNNKVNNSTMNLAYTDDDIETQISQFITVVPSSAGLRKFDKPVNNEQQSKPILKENTESFQEQQITSSTVTNEQNSQVSMKTTQMQNINLEDTKIVTLEEAVAMLGSSNEARALLSQLQVDVGESQEQIITETVGQDEDSNNVLDLMGQLDPQTGVYSLSQPSDDSEDSTGNTITQQPPTDIFSTALASADINLESLEYLTEDAESESLVHETVIEDSVSEQQTDTRNEQLEMMTDEPAIFHMPTVDDDIGNSDEIIMMTEHQLEEALDEEITTMTTYDEEKDDDR